MRKAIYLNEIPQEIRDNFKIIGRGATSIVFEKDKHTVLMFTRDMIKTEWLTRYWGLNIGEWIGEFKSTRHPLSNDFDINMIELPKLKKISNRNKRLLKNIMDKMDTVNYVVHHKKIDQLLAIQKTLDENNKIELIFIEFINFLLNYGENQYIVDLHFGNTMETENGLPILIDPVVSKEIMDFII